MMACLCSEGFAYEKGERYRLQGWHDCAYIEARNSLIPFAESIADATASRDDRRAWCVAFLAAMDALVSEARALNRL